MFVYRDDKIGNVLIQRRVPGVQRFGIRRYGNRQRVILTRKWADTNSFNSLIKYVCHASLPFNSTRR